MINSISDVIGGSASKESDDIAGNIFACGQYFSGPGFYPVN